MYTIWNDARMGVVHVPHLSTVFSSRTPSARFGPVGLHPREILRHRKVSLDQADDFPSSREAVTCAKWPHCLEMQEYLDRCKYRPANRMRYAYLPFINCDTNMRVRGTVIRNVFPRMMNNRTAAAYTVHAKMDEQLECMHTLTLRISNKILPLPTP